METTPPQGRQEKPIVTSAVWPVPRRPVIPIGGDEGVRLKAYLDLPMLHCSDDDPDQDFESLEGDSLEALTGWRSECERCPRIVDGAWSLDDAGVLERNGSYALRWRMLHLIAEYAQHARTRGPPA